MGARMTAAKDSCFCKENGGEKKFRLEELLYAVGTPSQSVSHVDGISMGTPRRPSTGPLPALRDYSSDESHTSDS